MAATRVNVRILAGNSAASLDSADWILNCKGKDES